MFGAGGVLVVVVLVVLKWTQAAEEMQARRRSERGRKVTADFLTKGERDQRTEPVFFLSRDQLDSTSSDTDRKPALLPSFLPGSREEQKTGTSHFSFFLFPRRTRSLNAPLLQPDEHEVKW
jgi:hypothetical protein